jgi:hypothetical protein
MALKTPNDLATGQSISFFYKIAEHYLTQVTHAQVRITNLSFVKFRLK